MKKGVFWSRGTSFYLKKRDPYPPQMDDFINQENITNKREKYTFNWFNILGVTLRSISGIGAQVVYFIVVYTASHSNISFSIILSIYAISPFVTGFFCLIFFKEKLTIFHLIGMVILTVAVVVLSQSSNVDDGGE